MSRLHHHIIMTLLLFVSCSNNYEDLGEQTISGEFCEIRCPYSDENAPGALRGAIYANDGRHYFLNAFYSPEVIISHYFEDTLILKVFKDDDDIQAGDIPVFEGDTLLMTGLVTKRTYKGKKNDATFKKGDYYFINGRNIKIIGRGEIYYTIINWEIERQEFLNEMNNN